MKKELTRQEKIKLANKEIGEVLKKYNLALANQLFFPKITWLIKLLISYLAKRQMSINIIFLEKQK